MKFHNYSEIFYDSFLQVFFLFSTSSFSAELSITQDKNVCNCNVICKKRNVCQYRISVVVCSRLLAMPCESLLIEVYDELWTFDARQLRWNQHRFGAVLPLNEKGEFTFDVGRTDNLLRLESILERILLVL